MKKTIYAVFVALIFAANIQTVNAEAVNFDILAATPVGSWQLREDTETNHKGKQTVSTIRTSLVGTEMRGSEKHYWVEMAMESFKVKKSGKRKQQGERMIFKSLIPASTFKGDPANIMNNLRGFGVEVIMQSGNEDPMRMNSGGMMAGLMEAMQADINYDFKALGNEEVSVTAGTFDTAKIQGSGTVEMNAIFKKIRVESDTTAWMSKKIPFGTAKLDGTSLMNGKQSSHKSELVEFGMSGAVSEITKEPTDMPEMPNIGELFGQ